MKNQDKNQKPVPDGKSQAVPGSVTASKPGSASPGTEKKEVGKEGSSGIANNLKLPQTIEMPKGGGAIRGIGEKAEVNPVTGSGTVSIPLPLTPGRSEFTPPLSLSYSSGNGNSEFGLGWQISLPQIARKTDKELPRYNDEAESDTFILSDAEDLVPIIDSKGNIKIGNETITGRAYAIRYYRPRTEGLFARIERLTDSDGVSFWRVTGKDNTVSLYGRDSSARVADPDCERHIFCWKLQATLNSHGNLIRYNYQKENGEANTCLISVEYGNAIKCDNILENYIGDFYMALLFRYRDRQDPFSVFKPGFEVRTERLCEGVEMHHYLPEKQEMVKVKELALKHADSGVSLLISATLQGYDGEEKAGYPAIDFTYSRPQLPSRSKSLDSLDLENLPGGLDSNVGFADLWGEGISGALIRNERSWLFKPNMGNRRWYDSDAADEIDLGKAKVLKELPGLMEGNMAAAQLTDIDGDGLNEIQVFSGHIRGYYSFDESGTLEPFIPFKEYPNIDFNDPNIKMLDLNGDGYPDMLFSGDDCFLLSYSKTKEGYSAFERVCKAINEEQGPRVAFAEARQTIFIADMSGDGLNDIVRITNGSVVYWPNLGYGRFGKKRVMKDAPRFDHSDTFDPSRLRLADIDGSGTTDILYLGATETRFWKNLSGNGWSDAVTVGNFPKTDSLTDVSVFDIEGNGTSALVWSTPLPDRPNRIKYIELSGGKKPFLLTEINNNMGAVRKFFYAPSTKFYLQDKREGRPWITRLGFPVHVVERIEVNDRPSESTFITRYAYHHGFFDGYEREFRGFGMVEQWDTEDYPVVKPKENTEKSLSLDIPPVYTKTWFHTGFWKGHQQISDLYSEEYWKITDENGKTTEPAWWLDDTLLPELTGKEPGTEISPVSSSIQEKREACRALRGSILRQEIYALDGSDKQDIPYTVEEKNYTVKYLQRQGNNKHAVCLKTDRETLMYHYERNISDPRVLHTMILDTDEYGNITQQAEIAYPRRANVSGILPEQRKILATYTENSYINETETSYHIGISCQVLRYEIHNLELLSNEKFTINTILGFIKDAEPIDYAVTPATNTKQKRLIGHEKTTFLSEDLKSELDFGWIAFHGLPFRTYTLEWSEGLINAFDKQGTEGLLTGDSCGFIAGNDLCDCNFMEGRYYKGSDKVTYDSGNFYLPVITTDQFGNWNERIYDPFKIFPVRISYYNAGQSTGENPLYRVEAEYDYRVMQPEKMTDANGNHQLLAFDTLGMVVAMAMQGKNGEGDTLEYPTEKYTYDLNCWQSADDQQPVWSKKSLREQHGNPESRILEAYTWTDGLGNELMTKTKAAPGKAWSIVRDENGKIIEVTEKEIPDYRWLSGGKVIYNNKGLAVKQYEPWYSDNPNFENEEILNHHDMIPQESSFNYDCEDGEMVCYHGVTPLFYYDPLGRLVRTQFPDGTESRVEFTVWQQKNYDQNDCSDKSAHRDTPQIIDFDTLGRPYRTTDDNGINEKYTTTHKLDITGRIVETIDAKGRTITRNLYGLSEENLVYTHNIDSGSRWILNDYQGNLRYRWDSRNQRIRMEYDGLLRPVKTFLLKENQPEITFQHIIYGNQASENNIGRIAEIMAQDGKTGYEYDFKGNVTLLYKQFPKGISDLEKDITELGPEGEKFTTLTEYDALNRTIAVTNPDGSTITYDYDEGGMLKSVRNGDPAYISGITYNARGQREKIYYGNQTRTCYGYHPLNFRLTCLKTTRKNENDRIEVMQHLNYEYDPAGNITKITDYAQQTYYFQNHKIDPEWTFRYDHLYRLVKATGREKNGLAAAGPNNHDFPDNIPCPDHSADGMRKYNHTYVYDELGNILKDPWKEYHYTSSGANNYLLGVGKHFFIYEYDAHGNTIKMPHLSTMGWDCQDRLIYISNGEPVKAYYGYDADGNRTRKVVVKNNGSLREEYYYIGGYECYKSFTNEKEDSSKKRETVNISDDQKVFVRIESRNDKSVTRYQYDNHLGSSCLELDENASIISYEEYYPFGATSYRSGKNETEVSSKRYKYCGKERDEETGLYYYGARYYAAWLCRFMSVDPLQHERSWTNPFNYCQNNPSNRIDINGMLDDEWLYNTVSGELTKISDMGGKDVQFVVFGTPSENGGLIHEGTASIGGEKVYAGEKRGGWVAATIDLWKDIPENYNDLSRDYLKGGPYEYSMLDLKKRYEIFNNPKLDISQIHIMRTESAGNAQPIHSIEGTRQYIAKWGTDKSFGFAIEGGFWSPQDKLPIMDAASEVLKASKNILGTFGKRGLFQLEKDSKIGNSFPNSGTILPSTAKKSSNLWNEFLKENKGKYKGQDWIKKASNDYHLWKSYIYKAN